MRQPRLLYLLRHGEAEQGWPDESRRLTPAGEAEVDICVRRAASRIAPLDRIFHSGLVRAQQTARVAAQALNYAGPMDVMAGVDPRGDAASATKLLDTLPWQAAMLVTHNPFVADLVQWLTGDAFRIRTGELIAIEAVDLMQGGGRTLWRVDGRD